MMWPILEARAEIEKHFVRFLVQMKTSKFAFEINWPLTEQRTFEKKTPKKPAVFARCLSET